MAEDEPSTSSSGLATASGPAIVAAERDVSVRALRAPALSVLSALLNPRKVFTTESNLPRDWLGLVELMHIGSERVPQLNTENDPTVKVLDLWVNMDAQHSTVQRLLEYLEQLDRFDVIADIEQYLDSDIEAYRNRKAVAGTSTSNGAYEPGPCSVNRFEDQITNDDKIRCSQGLGPQYYDAFVLFADDDIDFATQLLNKLEDEYNMKLCCKIRDVLAGHVELDVMMRLIETRCTRLVLILSSSFFKSAAYNYYKYYIDFARSIAIERDFRKIIPCLIQRDCDIPMDMKQYFILDYTKAGSLFNFWDKLHQSIQVCSIKNGHPDVHRSVSMQARHILPPRLDPPIFPHNNTALGHSMSMNGEKPSKKWQRENSVKFSISSTIGRSPSSASDMVDSLNGNHLHTNAGDRASKPTKSATDWLRRKMSYVMKHKKPTVAPSSSSVVSSSLTSTPAHSENDDIDTAIAATSSPDATDIISNGQQPKKKFFRLHFKRKVELVN